MSDTKLKIIRAPGLLKRIKIPDKILNKIGQVTVKQIVVEARKDAAKSRSLGTMNLPESKDFYDSFSYKIAGNGIEILSTWEWITPIVEGVKPFKMVQLTQQSGVKAIPLRKKDGTVIFRAAPLTMADAWIHPGIAKHTFINRGVRKGFLKGVKLYLTDILKGI